VPEFIDPVFVKTSPKHSFSVIENERIGLAFTKTGSIISDTEYNVYIHYKPVSHNFCSRGEGGVKSLVEMTVSSCEKQGENFLKVPKCEIFDPFFFTSINPIWVGDLRTGEEKFFFRRPRQLFAILYF
jgi:hypothetical protein